MNKTKKLVIVQNRPTQFDVPVYARIHAETSIELLILYTEVNPARHGAIDDETSIAPAWDHLAGLYYPTLFLHSAVSLWRQIVLTRPDHVIICGWYPRQHAVLAILLRLSCISIGVRSDNTLVHTDLSGVRGHIKRVVMFFWLGLYNTWHPVGALARSYVEHLSLIRRPVFYFPYAIDTDWFANKAETILAERSRWRKRYELAPNDFVVLGVMKWTDREDPMTLVDAILQCAVTDPNTKLLLVGDGPLRDLIEKRANTRLGCVIMPGYAKYSELPMYYAISDLFVHPAVSEPYGVSVQEAMSCGLPVITSDRVGAAKDLLEPGVNGDMFSVGGVEELAGLIAKYSSYSYRKSMREVSLRKATDWSYAKTLHNFNECLVYNSAI